MTAGIIKNNNVETKTFGVLEIKNLLKNEMPFSVSTIKINGVNKLVKNKICNAVYFIIKGNGEFLINKKIHSVNEGDIVYLPKNTIYKDSGKMEMLSIYQPQFDQKQVEYLD